MPQPENSSTLLTEMLAGDWSVKIPLMKLSIMQRRDIHQNFKRQRAPECLSYTGRKELAYCNMLYRQYKGPENELDIIGPYLESETSDLPIIRALINNLKKRDIPASARLMCYGQDVLKTIETYRLGEAYTAPYYSRLSGLLYELCESLHSLRNNVQDEILNNLEALYQNKLYPAGTFDFGRQEIELYCVVLGEFLSNMRVFYRELWVLLEEESDNSHRIALLSPVEEYLQNLAEMTEVVLYTMECTQLAFEEWSFCLEIWELQEMYN